jgi:hypothetical protein
MRVLGCLLCLVIAINLVLFVLTFIPAFSGFGPQPGLADRLWGDYRFGGWRADVVWVYASSVAVFFFGLIYARSGSARQNQEYKFVVLLSAVWLACFVVYAGYVLIHMMG